MQNLRWVELDGKIGFGPLRFLKAAFSDGGDSPLATIYYSLDDKSETSGLRLDLSKRAFLDTTGVVEVDAELERLAPLVADLVSLGSQTVVKETPKRFELQQPVELDGYFWVPGEGIVQTPGTLKYQPDDGIRVSLTGGLQTTGPRRNPFAMENYPIIHAQFSDGGVATMLDSFTSRRQFGSGGEGKAEIVTNQCIFGLHASSLDLLRFTGCRLRFTSLEEWTSGGSFAVERTGGSAGSPFVLTARHTQPPPILLNVDDEGLRLSIHTGASTEQTLIDLRITELSSISLARDDARSLDYWLEKMWCLQMLFSLFVGEAAAFVEEALAMTVSWKDQQSRVVECPYLAMQRIRKIKTHLHPVEMILPRQTIGERLNHIVDEWFDLYRGSKQSLASFFETLFSPDIPLEMRFLSVLSALEVFHRSTAGESEVSLEERVTSTANALPPDLRSAILGSGDDLIQRAIRTKDYLSHGLSSQNVRLLEGMSLHIATDKFRALFLATLLARIDIPTDSIADLLKRKSWIRWAMEQDIQ